MSTTASALIRAAADGDADGVRASLAAGADVNARTPAGDTALIRAAFFGHAEAVRVLLAAGADAQARDGYDLTAYEWCVRKGFYDVARLLRENATADASHPPSPVAEKLTRRKTAQEVGGRDADWLRRVAGAEAGGRAEGESSGRAGERKSQEPPAGTVLKRCPKCHSTYRGEILAYCPRDTERLVGADEPQVEAEHSGGAPRWVWALVAFTLLAGVYAGYLINRYGSAGPTAPAQTGAAVRWERPVTGGALKGKEVSLPDPQYPAEVAAEGATGQVTVEVKVNKKGEVISARAVSGPPPLHPACEKAASESKFSPGIPARRAASASGTITYTIK